MLPACQMVGRPSFFAIVIMLVSFLPVFALGGMNGQMFRPLAYTKTLAIALAAFLAVTLDPAVRMLFARRGLRSAARAG